MKQDRGNCQKICITFYITVVSVFFLFEENVLVDFVVGGKKTHKTL